MPQDEAPQRRKQSPAKVCWIVALICIGDGFAVYSPGDIVAVWITTVLYAVGLTAILLSVYLPLKGWVRRSAA